MWHRRRAAATCLGLMRGHSATYDRNRFSSIVGEELKSCPSSVVLCCLPNIRLQSNGLQNSRQIRFEYMDVDVRRRRNSSEIGNEWDGLDGFWRAGAGRCGVYTGQE